MSANLEDLESDDFESEADNVTDIGSVTHRDTMPRPSDTKIRMSGQQRREQLLAVGREAGLHDRFLGRGAMALSLLDSRRQDRQPPGPGDQTAAEVLQLPVHPVQGAERSSGDDNRHSSLRRGGPLRPAEECTTAVAAGHGPAGAGFSPDRCR